jgi:hypothetical protein
MEALDPNEIVGMGSVLVNVGQICQARKLFYDEAEKTKYYHEESKKLAEKQHEKDLLLLKQTYLMDVFVNLEQHFQQLNAGSLFIFDFILFLTPFFQT